MHVPVTNIDGAKKLWPIFTEPILPNNLYIPNLRSEASGAVPESQEFRDTQGSQQHEAVLLSLCGPGRGILAARRASSALALPRTHARKPPVQDTP